MPYSYYKYSPGGKSAGFLKVVYLAVSKGNGIMPLLVVILRGIVSKNIFVPQVIIAADDDRADSFCNNIAIMLIYFGKWNGL